MDTDTGTHRILGLKIQNQEPPELPLEMKGRFCTSYYTHTVAERNIIIIQGNEMFLVCFVGTGIVVTLIYVCAYTHVSPPPHTHTHLL